MTEPKPYTVRNERWFGNGYAKGDILTDVLHNCHPSPGRDWPFQLLHNKDVASASRGVSVRTSRRERGLFFGIGWLYIPHSRYGTDVVENQISRVEM